eukprot:1020514-Pyramimonas_sp.AAC.2
MMCAEWYISAACHAAGPARPLLRSGPDDGDEADSECVQSGMCRYAIAMMHSGYYRNDAQRILYRNALRILLQRNMEPPWAPFRADVPAPSWRY